MSKATESMFDGKDVLIPLAEVSYILKFPSCIEVHFKGSAESVTLVQPDQNALISAWCRYRSEVEADTLMDLGHAQPASSEGSITAGILSGMFLSLDGHDKAQPGYEWRKGWNDAIRQAMDYAQPTPSMPKLHVGYLPTINQDGYPALGAWWVQLWDGDDVFARVYGSSPEEAHNRAEMLAAAPEAKP